MSNDIIDTLHPLERKVLPKLANSTTINDIIEKTKLKQVEIMRALQWLEDKNILKLKSELKEIIQLTNTGKKYTKKTLPEKIFIKSLPTTLNKLKEILSKDELNVSMGILKKARAISISKEIKALPNAKTILNNNQIEDFLNNLPKESTKLDKDLTKDLLKRGFIQKQIGKLYSYTLTDLGKKLTKLNLKTNLIEALTPKLLTSGDWKGKKFRKYNIKSPAPQIYPGKRHFNNYSINRAKKIWLEMGFEEMTGDMILSSFWNFDALFTAQDHPVREIHDTFFINKISNLPNKKLVNQVKKAHEGKIANSKGWGYKWDENEAKKTVLRTHTTPLSAQTLSKLDLKTLPRKFFAIGRNFRNEAVDWSHSFEFNQTEGIVIDENATFQDLLGYLTEFANKMGFKKIRFRPAYFPYTEPSVEGDVYDEKHKKWVELIAAGIFRPEVVVPLIGKDIPVLAWGPGLDRMTTTNYNLKGIREIYKNDLKQLRETKCHL